jgi:anhydro-N-acetylmuramic acid kinase
VVAARVGAPVVSDFRTADMAAGGQGAPLVPFLDYLVFRHPRRGRIVQNLGGIANLTAIPAGASLSQVLAFDTGPGNMVIDAVMERLYGRSFDRDGRSAARGKVLGRVLAGGLRQPFFRQLPPKSAGREQFGREFVADFLRNCGRARKEDIVTTATALTACSISEALCRFVLATGTRRRRPFSEFVVSGGGTRNRTLMHMLEGAATVLGLRLRRPEEFRIPSEGKEAVAFALLAYQTWQRRPSSIPSATGAKRAAVLGKVSYP